MARLSNNDIANAIYIGAKNKQGNDLNLFMQDVVKFLVQKKLFSKRKDILKTLEKIIDKDNSLLQVNLYTKNKIDENFKKELSSILQKKYQVKNIIFNEKINENLIDGFRLEIDDEIIDTSISNKLKKLQTYLTK